VLPFTGPNPGGFWKFYADRQSGAADFFSFWAGFVLIPSFMLVSGYLSATWYALGEISGPLVWFGLGTIPCRYRGGIGKTLALRPLTLFGLNAVLFVLAALFGAQTAPVYWLTCCLGALAAFQACLYLARYHSRLRGFRLYRYFEDNAFRFYLFHVPGVYLTHRMLAAAGLSSPLPFMLLSFAGNFCLTACLVAVLNTLEKRLAGRFLPGGRGRL
jgi:hypothetical protein